MAAPAVAGNLPGGLTSFVGRDREVGEAKRLLADARLVTLTGVGGTGKTRLALRVAEQVQRAFPHGVWFVDLAQLHDARDPDLLAFLVAATLGLREGGGRPLPEADMLELVAGLVDKSILTSDNVRHGRVHTAPCRMLETIRDYGHEKLREAGEEVALRRQHRDWYERLAARASVRESGCWTRGSGRPGSWTPRPRSAMPPRSGE